MLAFAQLPGDVAQDRPAAKLDVDAGKLD